MSQLVKHPEQTTEIREYLEQQAKVGHEWVVYDVDNPIDTKFGLYCFPDEWEALDFARENQQIWNWHEAVPIKALIFDLKELEQSYRKGTALTVYEFSDLKDVLVEAGYPGHWVNERLPERIPPAASDFSLRELVNYKGEQLLIELDFDLRKGSIRLDKLTAHLLNGPATSDQIPDMTPRSLLTVWQAESTEYNELVPLFIIGDSLIAARELSREHPDLTAQLLNTKIMNLNNLEDLQSDMEKLGFSEKSIKQMEENMKQGLHRFDIRETRPASEGQVEILAPFKLSGQSDSYYFNKFTATHHQNDRPLEDGKQYIVTTYNQQEGNTYKKLDHLSEALEFFKAHKGNSELAIGKDVKDQRTLAKMEDGKVNYVNKDFRTTYYTDPFKQTFYTQNGNGYTIEQAANLVQKRAVYRNDLLNRKNEIFKSWAVLDIDKPRDKYNNLPLKHYYDPAYGFNLTESLNKYRIKEMESPGKAEELETQIRNGHRPLVNVQKDDGQWVERYLEAAVRYTNLNFLQLDGKTGDPREQFQKEAPVEKSQGKENIVDKKVRQGREKGQATGMEMGR